LIFFEHAQNINIHTAGLPPCESTPAWIIDAFCVEDRHQANLLEGTAARSPSAFYVVLL
jgi:hypothetical protein